MILSNIQLIALVFAALLSGIFLAWVIRGQRIQQLEKLLRSYQKKITSLEMDIENLEAFANHVKKSAASKAPDKKKNTISRLSARR